MVSNKAELIRSMLEDGLTPKEIKETLQEDEIKVSSQYIYNVKRAWVESKGKSKNREENTEDNEGDEEDEDFIAKFPREKRKKVPEFEDYECGACGAAWRAPRNKIQVVCPQCGVYFE